MSTEQQAPNLSPAVRDAYNELVSVMLWIDANGKDVGFHGDLSNMTAAACFDLVLEHQSAVALLVANELNGSALVLLRVMAESLIRGMWFHHCATDAELQRFKEQDKLDRGIRALASEVEAKLGNVQDAMSEVIRGNWDLLCSYTHTGFEQVYRRYTGDMLKPSYPECDIVLALRFAGGMGLLAVLGLAAVSGNLQLMTKTLARANQFTATRSA
jgi:hypothetical protein